MKLRGMPNIAAYIDRNIFAHHDLDDAIALRTHTHVHLGTGPNRNLTGYDSYGRYGVCDFDGDGRDDLFLPTGETWWYSSAGQIDWVFLKEATERIDNVGLGDFDADGRCDVIALGAGNKLEISSAGSGAWTPLPGTFPYPFSQLRFADFNGDGRTDIFRRASSGQWYVISPGVHGWHAIQSSSFPITDLRFGDFNGDRKADVLSRNGGHWSVSFSGTGAWTRINNLSDSLNSLLIADVDGNGKDDLVRYKVSTANKGTWQVSWGGRTVWKNLRTVTVPPPPQLPLRPLVTQRVFVGKFDATHGADLLHIDYNRIGRLFDYVHQTLSIYNFARY
jgi:hypothetical protein